VASRKWVALPGSHYVNQGEELGIPEAYDLPIDVLRDPTWERYALFG
jgi:alpha-glucosidase